MGLEILFLPITVIIFISIISMITLVQWHLLDCGPRALGLGKILRGYSFVFLWDIVFIILENKPTLREILSYLLLNVYGSFAFTAILLLPLTFFIAKYKKLSILLVTVSGASLALLLSLGDLFSTGVDKIIEHRKIEWVLQTTNFCGTVAVISFVFAVGLLKRDRNE